MTKRICAERTCRDCGVDIENLPKGVRRCLACVMGMMRQAQLAPLEPYPGPNAPWLCRCLRCGNEVAPRFGNIAAGVSQGCKPCAAAGTGNRCRETEEAAVASMRAAGFEPLVPYPGTVLIPWPSRCMTCGEETSPKLNNVRTRGWCCKHCSGRAPDPRDRVEVMRAAGLEPIVPFPGHDEPWPALCQRCGCVIDPYYSSIRMGHGCRWCNWKTVSPDIAVADMRAAGFEPLEPYPGMKGRWRCRCMKCGDEVAPWYISIRYSGGGCRWCQKAGFSSAASAIVYLIVHQDYAAAKVGIGHSVEGRLHKHQRRGWEALLVMHVTGPVAMATEDAILAWWRNDLGLLPHLGPEEMPQTGWTETVAVDEIDLAETMRRIRRLAA